MPGRAAVDVELSEHQSSGPLQHVVQLCSLVQERKAALVLLEARLVGRELAVVRRVRELAVLLQRVRPPHAQVLPFQPRARRLLNLAGAVGRGVNARV